MFILIKNIRSPVGNRLEHAIGLAVVITHVLLVTSVSCENNYFYTNEEVAQKPFPVQGLAGGTLV